MTDIYRLCQLADFYCALPAISRMISDAIMSSDDPVGKKDQAESLIDIAIKFHHRKLFQDCMIHITGHQAVIRAAVKHSKATPAGLHYGNIDASDYGNLDASLIKVADAMRGRVDR